MTAAGHIRKFAIPGFPGYRVDQFGTVYGRKGDPIRINARGMASCIDTFGRQRHINVEWAMREAGIVRDEPILPQEDPAAAPTPPAPDPRDGIIAQLRRDLDERTESLRLAREVNRHLIARMRSLEGQVRAAVHGSRRDPRAGRDLYDDDIPASNDEMEELWGDA